MTTINMKKTFVEMLRSGRTAEEILNDINEAERTNKLDPKMIPETLRIFEEARREFVGA